MIIYISLAYGLLVTAGAIAVYILKTRECRRLEAQGYGQYQRAERLAGEVATLKTALVNVQKASSYYSRLFRDTEFQLRKIEQKRHASAKHARAAQLAQQRAAQEATTAKLNREISSKTERKAA